jgi:predicted NBD/HSP70 family sugar kinase
MHLFIDIGGTNTRLTVSEDGKSFPEPVIFPTEQNFEAALQDLDKEIHQLISGSITSTIVGLPGVLDQAAGSLSISPNLPQWIDQPIIQKIKEVTDSPTSFFNDSALAGLGEAWFGAGKDYSIVTYLTISTGVGGARIVNKQIDEMTYGFEPGFQIIDASGKLCPDCHHPSSLEDLVGGANVAKRFKCHPKDIKDQQVWDTIALWLSYGLNNVISLWSPEVIVLGGPMMRDIPIDKVREYTEKLAVFVPQIPDIKAAKHEKDKAFYGALALLDTTNN